MATNAMSALFKDSNGESSGFHRSLKRHRLPSDDEDDEDNDDINTESFMEEVDDDSDPVIEELEGFEEFEEEEEEDEEEEEERYEHVTGTRMATVGNDHDDMITEAQSVRFVSNSPSSKSPQSVKLQSSEILDCPTCFEPLKRPIYQCTNGHIACSSCCTKMNKKCSFCRSDIGDIRCRAMEKIIEATIVPCPNAIHGCKETTTYGNQSIHEKECVFIQCSCPLPDCSFTGSYADLKTHARATHAWDDDILIPFMFNCPLTFSLDRSTKLAFFQEEIRDDLFVVQSFEGLSGVYVTVSCIAPMTQGICNFSCSLAKLNEFSTLRLGLMVKKIQKVSEQERPQDGFMMIPPYMLNNEHCKMEICIGHGNKYVHV